MSVAIVCVVASAVLTGANVWAVLEHRRPQKHILRVEVIGPDGLPMVGPELRPICPACERLGPQEFQCDPSFSVCPFHVGRR